MFFSPDCEFCRKELEGVVFYKDSFAGIDWVFVTFLPREDLDEFLLEYPLYAIPGAKICIAESPEPFTAFDVTAPPSLFIYDAGGHLEHYKCGAVSIKTILEWTE